MTSAAMPAAGQSCPQCSAPLWNDAGFVSWCERCEWNIQPEKEEPEGRLAALYGRLGRRMGQGLFESVIKARDPLARPALTPGNLAAVVIAVAVHAVGLAIVAAGLLLVIRGWPNILLTGLGLICLAVAVMSRPRPARMPKDLVPRSQAPELYGLFDEIAAALGAGKIHGLRVTADFNASFTQIGPARKPVVAVGLPLFSILNRQEKVAICAHELAHGVNGDPMRGFVVRSAMESLRLWAGLIRPARLLQSPSQASFSGAIASILMIPVNVLRAGLASLVDLLAYAMIHLVYRNSQRAEYLADALAARVGGTAGVLAALEKQYYGPTVGTVTLQVKLNQRTRQPGDLFAAIKERVATLPPREVERLRRISLRDGARLDVSHPPTSQRVAALRARPQDVPLVELSAEREARIERELAQFAPAIQQELLGSRQYSLRS